MPDELLSFSLRPVETHDDLLLACQVRAQAYGRKFPEYVESMSVPDATDSSPWTAVFLCEDKFTGEPVGTMRIQSTTRGNSKLEIEKYMQPTPELLLFGRAEVTRLAAVQGADPFVRLALWKAAYLYCMATQARWLIMGVRKPSLLRAYQQMGATDVFEDRRTVRIAHGGDLPHRVLALDIGDCERKMREDNNPVAHFLFGAVHQDISVMPSVHRRVAKRVGLHVVQ